jgi:non-ribosomal peptide synthetase component F
LGLLGILKAGGAYVPLDPSYPAERLDLMLADAQVSVLLTQEGLFEDGESRINDRDRQSSILDRPIQRICLERELGVDRQRKRRQSRNFHYGGHLAYVIYTSGSTGQPRACKSRTRVCLNLYFGIIKHFPSRLWIARTQLAGPGFDAAAWELWPYLTVGASVYIADEMTRLDGASLRDG